jgi:glutathione S-transferase
MDIRFADSSGVADMHVDSLVVIVTFAALLLYLWMGIRVGRARTKYAVVAPAVTGAPEFERTLRVQMNTLEWLPLFLPSLWLFACYWDPRIAAAVGAVWILARLAYAISYVQDPAKRGLGFGLQALATFVLLFGALGKAIWLLATGG